MGKAIWENPIEVQLGEGFTWECLFVHREKGLFLSVYVDDVKRDEFYDSLQFGTEVYSDASSIKKYRMQRQQWRNNWKKKKLGENTGMAADKRQEQKRGDRGSKE